MPHLADAASYLLDTCATFTATLSALPQSAAPFLQGSQNQIVKQIAVIHDVIQPHMARVGRGAVDSHERTVLLSQFELLALAAAKAVQLLITEGVLSERQDVNAAASSSKAAAEDDGAALGDKLVHVLMELQVWKLSRHDMQF